MLLVWFIVGVLPTASSMPYVRRGDARGVDLLVSERCLQNANAFRTFPLFLFGCEMVSDLKIVRKSLLPTSNQRLQI